MTDCDILGGGGRPGEYFIIHTDIVVHMFREGASSRMDALEADRTSVQAQLLQRMTEALSRMLNDPGALHRYYNIIDI